MWVNNFADQSAQYAALNVWMTQGGPNLLKSLPVTNNRQVNAFQWVISDPAEPEEGDMMMAVYTDCKLEEGLTADRFMIFIKILLSMLNLKEIQLEER